MNKHACKSSLAVALPDTPDGTVPEWIQIMPAGTFSARDGRGPWTCEPEKVVKRIAELNGPVEIPMDYDHQIERASKNGQPALAAAWISDIEARADGIWGRVTWTPKARAHVSAREYRYVSPSFYHSPEGTILYIESVALTNVPALVGLKALASREVFFTHTQTGDSSMTFLKSMASVVGVTDAEPTEAAVEAALRRLTQDSQSFKTTLSACGAALNTEITSPEALIAAVKVAASAAAHPDPAKYVPVATFDAINAELGGMKAAQASMLVEQAMADGKITPAMEAWAKDYAASNPQGFQAYLAKAPDQRPGTGKSEHAKTTPPEGSGEKLSALDKSLCQSLGMSEEKYMKSMQTTQNQGEDDDSADA